MQAGHFAQCVVLLRIVTIHQWKVVAVVIVRSVNLFHRKTKPKKSSYGEYYVADQEQKRERDLIKILTLLVVLVC